MGNRAVLKLGRSICGDFEAARRREWLCTNGLGGYAMGAVSGSLERTYHGLLIEATAPPLGRMLRLAKLDPVVTVDGVVAELDANAWEGGAVAPRGDAHLERFKLEDGVPVWVFQVAGRRFERRLAMVPGQNTTVVSWRLLDEGAAVDLTLKALGAARIHHHTTGDGGPRPDLRVEGARLVVNPNGFRTMTIDAAGGRWSAGTGETYQGFFLRIESERGLGLSDSHRHLGELSLRLEAGTTAHIVASTEPDPPDGPTAWTLVQARIDELMAARAKVSQSDSDEVRQLVLAADQFIVSRTTDGRTIMAGYPWFGDWGRDTMIALPGLALSTGRPDVAARILRTFARFVDKGMLPNRFPGAGEPPEYNTVDATMWYFHAIEATVEALDNVAAVALLKDLVPVLGDIVRHHLEGTRYGIRVDSDGLVTSGADGVQLTWMDARVGKRVITPRRGKPVEINGLWLHGLTALARFRRRIGRDSSDLDEHIQRARAAFARYWNPETGALFDVLDGDDGDDPSIRPNQLIALALPSCPLSPEQRRSAVAVAGRHLLSSHGMRSLSPEHPDYVGHYAGPPSHRDGCYHQGTVWGWLIGPWVRARLAVGHSPQAVRGDLEPLLDHLTDALVGSASEIFDGDAPFTPRGAPAQAWSVAEALASWDAVQ